MRRRGLLLGVLWLCAGPLCAQAPWADWRTIETAHFRVHYPAPFEAWARRMAGSVEGIHERVTALVGYTPQRKTDVLVSDPQAESNGMALPFLDRPVIVLWTTPPGAESGIGSYRDWTELLVTHEMAHIVHLTRPKNRAGFLSRLLPLGPVAIQAPRWVTEGYATLIEGELTGSGRPSSSFRAMVLRRFAIEGKLPSYGALSASGGWLGGSMAYLVGSSYLEWLEAREGKGSLVKLWKRLASRKGGSFATAFRAVFGEAPNDLYDRFRAELTAAALDSEKKLRLAGLVEGERWQRLAGGTSFPQVSPDGGKLLARRDPAPGKGFLAVWDLRAAPTSTKRKVQAESDPNEIEDKPETPPRREPKWRLPRINGFAAAEPRFLPDGRRILFARRAPDSEGALRLDLYLWEFETGRVSRITRGEDVAEADPAPDGRFAVGVRRRFGTTGLVRVDLSTGRTRTIDTDASAAWPVWSHPRVSPDGAAIAALLHREGRWRLVTVPVSGGAVRAIPLEGSPSGPPAWSTDGSRLIVAADSPGIWNLASVDARGSDPQRELTQVLGGAFAPAPAPDGSELFFLELTARGVDLRRLAASTVALARAAPEPGSYPILPPPPSAVERPQPRQSDVPPPAPYRALATQVVRLSSGFTLGPDGSVFQAGVQGTDVVGRLDWLAAASFGSAAGPRGGALAVAWKGLPVKLNVHLFASLEKPGSQHLVKRPELDEQRFGGWAGGSWRRPFSWGRVFVEAGGGWTRVEPVEAGDALGRGLGSLRAGGSLRHRGEQLGYGLDLDASGMLGATGGAFWRQVRGEARAVGSLGPARLSIAGRWGDTGGSPTRFDVFRLGGASSTILSAGLDGNRIDSPALPEAAQLGRRFEGWRAEATISFLTFYAERERVFDSGPKPEPVQVWGGEVRLDTLLPPGLAESFDLYVGLAKIRSTTPRFDSLRGYGGLIYRP